MPEEIKNIVLTEINHIKKELTCSICLDLFSQPVTLTTCQHTFCLECFKGLILNKLKSKTIECPMCKKIINRRSYYFNTQFAETVDFIKMCDKLQTQSDSNKDKDIYDLTNRMKKFLDDCMTFKELDTCVSLSTSSDYDSDSDLFKKLNSYTKLKENLSIESKIKTSKTPARNPKSLKCKKITGKYQKRSKKNLENANVSDVINIDEYDSPGISDIQGKENKLVKLLEDDCLENMENEFHNISKIEEEKNDIDNFNEKNKIKKQVNKNESNFNLNTTSIDTNSSKKTNMSGWSRMKTMKKQIKKKESKYKQLNVSTEINKSKSKSPQLRPTNLPMESSPIIVLDSDNSEDQDKKDITEIHVKEENISTDKLDLFLQCLEEDKKEQTEEEDVFAICTQKLQTVSKDFDINNIQLKPTENDNISNFIVDVQVHNCSTPIKNIYHEEIVEKVCSRRSLKDNICEVDEQIKEGNKLVTSNNKKISNSYSEISKAEKTPQSIKQTETRTRRSLRNSTKRNSEESNLPVDNKTTPKRKKVNKQSSNKKNTDSASKKHLKELEIVLVDDKNNDNKQNLSDKIDFVKNELKLFPVQESTAMSALKNSINAINTVLSQCSTYVNTPSLFSESLSSKNNVSQVNEKPNILLNRFHSLQLKTNSNSSLEFYATAIPCIKKIETFFENIISLSQEITNETEIFKNSYECKPFEKECVFPFNANSTNCVGVQTDNLTCPKCSYIIDFNSVDKRNSVEESSTANTFKEINDIDNIKQCDNGKTIDGNNSNEKLGSPKIKNSLQSSGSEICPTRKVNRQLTFSDDSTLNQRRKFKRIRSPTPDSDTESVKTKKSNVNYSNLLYQNDIDIFFQSEQSEKNMSLSSQSNDNRMKLLVKNYEDIITNSQKENPINPEDTTSKYISLLEREYKDAQFDKITKPAQTISNFDTAPNTVLDNLLASINLTVFENDNCPSDKNTNLTENRKQTNVTDVLSGSEFPNTDKEVYKNADADETKICENIESNLSKTLANENEDNELDKEVENITNCNLNVDSFESEKDIFGDDIIIENTPQKSIENNRERSRFNQLPEPILDIIRPPSTITENLEWIDIAPPPPPEFQDTEKIEETKITNISSITPDIFALNPLDKGFRLTNTNLSGDTVNQNVNECISKQFDYSQIVIPSSVSQNKEHKENILNKPLPQIHNTNKKNLNHIIYAEKEKFSPLQIVVNSNTSPKVICSIPKHQKSILNYMQTSQKENNANEINKSMNKMPSNQNIQSKSNALTPVKENLNIEVCESPVPHNKTSVLESKINTSENINAPERSKYSACIACTRLKGYEILQVLSLTQKYKARYCKEFDKNVTHLIVSVDDRNTISDYTIKYILAISHGIWVVSFAWIQDSIEQKRLLPEEPYEVLDVSGRPGPKISRLTRLSNPLFKNFVFCCVDPFVLVNKVDIEKAIINLGGEVKKSPIELLHHVNKNCLILVEPKETQDFDQYQDLRDSFNVLVVDIEWFSFTVGQYQIISVRPYILCLEKGINDLGYSPNLIAPVLETPSQFTNTNN